MAKFDWISVTAHNHEFSYYLNMWGRGKPSKPKNGYSAAMSWGKGISLYWGEKRMGEHLCLTGDGIAEYGEIQSALLVQNLANLGVNFTRLDLAQDILDSETVGEIASSAKFKMGEGVIRERQYKSFASKDTTETFYCGSRSSEVFTRVYDKGLKFGYDSQFWTRVEHECKRRTAQEIALSLTRAGDGKLADKINSLWAGLTLAMLGDSIPSIGLWGLTPEFIGVKPKERDRLGWINSTVLKSLARAYSEYGHAWFCEYALKVENMGDTIKANTKEKPSIPMFDQDNGYNNE
jgi:hypothetical protein